METNQSKDSGAPTAPEGRMKRVAKLALQYLIPLALTVLLVWYMFRKVNFSEMMAIIEKGVDLWWILLAMGISIFSHVFRAARWRLQLQATGIRPPFMALCCSIFGCYALNLVFPRLGEIWRCSYIAGKEKAPFTTVVGTMVTDRLADTLMVLTLFLLTCVVANGAINAFLAKYPVGRDLIGLAGQWWTWALLVAAIALGAWLLHVFRATKAVAKLREWWLNIWNGMSVVARMKGKWLFFWLTLCIWGCYFFQLYVAFYAFPFTRALCTEPYAWGLTPCLVAFVLSSIGMAVPSNGGLGPWNIAVMFGLAVFGISDAEGTAFSMLQWSGQTVMLIILGIYTMAYIALSGMRKRKVVMP